MDQPFRISRVGHVGIQVTKMDRSLDRYTNTLGLTFTGRWPHGEGGELCFLRVTDDHHNIVLFTHPTELNPDTRDLGYQPLQNIALEGDGRDKWLKALAEGSGGSYRHIR